MSKASASARRTQSLDARTSERRHEEFESFALVGGFSVSGLSLACILSKLQMNGDFSALTLLLVLCMMPVAVALGFALEGAER